MKLYTIVLKWVKELSRYRISLYAANASFYIILSAFPTIMLIVALLPVFGIGRQELLQATNGLIPKELTPLLVKFLEDMDGHSPGIFLSATAPIAIWSASRGIYYVRQGFHDMYRRKESLSFLSNRLSSIFYTVILILCLVFTLAVNGFGRSLVEYVSNREIPILKFVGAILKIRAVILLFILSGLFSAIYHLFPVKEQRLNTILPGAILGASGWLIFTEGYSLYVRFSGSYSLLYGSLSVIAMGMVWLYVCISIIFYGYILNIYIERHKKHRAA